MSGHAAFLAILILSEIAEVAAWAQQEPQYWGKCWLRTGVRKFVLLMFYHSQVSGKFVGTSGLWIRGSALLGFLMRHGAPIVLYLPASETPTMAAKANDFISLVLSNKSE